VWKLDEQAQISDRGVRSLCADPIADGEMPVPKDMASPWVLLLVLLA